MCLLAVVVLRAGIRLVRLEPSFASSALTRITKERLDPSPEESSVHVPEEGASWAPSSGRGVGGPHRAGSSPVMEGAVGRRGLRADRPGAAGPWTLSGDTGQLNTLSRAAWSQSKADRLGGQVEAGTIGG